MQYWFLTDPGCVRTSNQDAIAVEKLDRNNLLCVICDGMGGANGGNIASSIAIRTIASRLTASYRKGMTLASMQNVLESAIAAAMEKALTPAFYAAAAQVENPFYRPDASGSILRIIKQSFAEGLLSTPKHFYDVEAVL